MRQIGTGNNLGGLGWLIRKPLISLPVNRNIFTSAGNVFCIIA